MGCSTEYLNRAKAILRAKEYHFSLNGLLEWDLTQDLPLAANAYRQDMTNYLTAVRHALLSGGEIAELAKYFSQLKDSDYANAHDRAIGRHIIRTYIQESRVPEKLVLQLNHAMFQAQRTFTVAREKNDFRICEDAYRALFDLKGEIAHAMDPNRPPFEVIADQWDEGIDIAETSRLFDEVKNGIADILEKVQNSGKKFDNCSLKALRGTDETTEVVEKLMLTVGLPKDCTSFGRLQHPACAILGPRDSRVGINCDELVFSIISSLHEAGHGIYNDNSDDGIIDSGLWGGVNGSVHEGQARFYECMVGRSWEFWSFFYPQLQAAIPELCAVDLDSFYRQLNSVIATPIRIDSDELTYSLHPIIRFELEKEYYEGALTVPNFPAAWNRKYVTYLGVTPPDDCRGILQEGHWTVGYIGYFQSYVLGNLWCGQLRHQLLQDTPSAFDDIRYGNFTTLSHWLKEHVHAYGQIYTPAELIIKATGKPLSSRYFVDYLSQKYGQIYNLQH